MAEYGSGTAAMDPATEAKLQAWQQERSSDPRGYYAKLRAQCPVDFEQHLGAGGDVTVATAAVLSRGDIEEVLRNTNIFSSEMGIMGSEEPVIPLGVDPPLHAMYRRVLDPLFSPKKMAALQPTVAAQVNEMIDSFIDKGEVDFSAELAVPLPCLTFLALLGLPGEELDALVRWKDIMIRPDIVAGSREAGAELQVRTAGEIYQRFGMEMEARRDAPRDDLISYFMTVKVEDGRNLTDSEVLRILFLLLAAGLDTVTISLQAIFNYLAEHPEAQQLIQDDPDQIDNVIEELLRWETPVQNLTRIARWTPCSRGALSPQAHTSSLPCPRAMSTRRIRSHSPWTSPWATRRTSRSAAATIDAWARTLPGWNCGRSCVNGTSAFPHTGSSPGHRSSG